MEKHEISFCTAEILTLIEDIVVEGWSSTRWETLQHLLFPWCQECFLLFVNDYWFFQFPKHLWSTMFEGNEWNNILTYYHSWRWHILGTDIRKQRFTWTSLQCHHWNWHQYWIINWNYSFCLLELMPTDAENYTLYSFANTSSNTWHMCHQANTPRGFHLCLNTLHCTHCLLLTKSPKFFWAINYLHHCLSAGFNIVNASQGIIFTNKVLYFDFPKSK